MRTCRLSVRVWPRAINAPSLGNSHCEVFHLDRLPLRGLPGGRPRTGTGPRGEASQWQGTQAEASHWGGCHEKQKFLIETREVGALPVAGAPTTRPLPLTSSALRVAPLAVGGDEGQGEGPLGRHWQTAARVPQGGGAPATAVRGVPAAWGASYRSGSHGTAPTPKKRAT